MVLPALRPPNWVYSLPGPLLTLASVSTYMVPLEAVVFQVGALEELLPDKELPDELPSVLPEEVLPDVLPLDELLSVLPEEVLPEVLPELLPVLPDEALPDAFDLVSRLLLM